MRKTLLSILALSTSFFVGASSPELLWHKIIDSPQNAGDVMSCATVTTDGNVVTLGSFGSRTEADNISFDGTVIATGAATTSNSDNKNLLVIKHNAADGSRIWSVFSKKGDFSSSGSLAMAATADGGVAMLLEMRSSNVSPYESPVIVDASGAEIDFPDWNISCWVSYQVIVKLTANGYVEWVRPVIADQLPVPNASSGTSTLYTTRSTFPYTIATDSEDNLYIGGNFRTPMIFNGEGNATYILQPRNLENYNGDSQKSAGALYLVKLDSKGNYLTHLKASSTNGVDAEYINDIEIEGNNLYFAGKLVGDANCKLTIGSGDNAISVTKTSEQDAILLGSLKIETENNTLTPGYLTCFNQVKVNGNGATQFKDMIVANGSIYMMGLFQGGIANNDAEEAIITSVGKPLEGFCLRLNATDGKYQAGFANKISIGGYFGGGVYNDKLYLAGYRLNAQTGSFIDELDAENLELKSTTTIAKNGGSPTLMGAFYDPATTRLYTFTRGNAAFTLTDGTSTEKQNGYGFGTVVCSHAIDPSVSEINNIENDNATLSIKGIDGAIEITATEDTNISVVNTSGITVKSQSIAAGTTQIALPAGIYIVNNQKVAVR